MPFTSKILTSCAEFQQQTHWSIDPGLVRKQIVSTKKVYEQHPQITTVHVIRAEVMIERHDDFKASHLWIPVIFGGDCN